MAQKLYTQEQVRKLLKKAFWQDFHDGDTEDSLMHELTPIELPSDEEIGKEMDKLPFSKHIDDGMFNDGQLNGFELGATWMRDKIQGGNNEK